MQLGEEAAAAAVLHKEEWDAANRDAPGRLFGPRARDLNYRKYMSGVLYIKFRTLNT